MFRKAIFKFKLNEYYYAPFANNFFRKWFNYFHYFKKTTTVNCILECEKYSFIIVMNSFVNEDDLLQHVDKEIYNNVIFCNKEYVQKTISQIGANNLNLLKGVIYTLSRIHSRKLAAHKTNCSFPQEPIKYYYAFSKEFVTNTVPALKIIKRSLNIC